MSKQITLYHGTDFKSAENIMKKGFKSHTWFATNSKRAKLFGKIKSNNPIILQVKINLDELKNRVLINQSTTAKKSLRVIGHEYLLHSYRLPRLQAIIVMNK